MTSRMTKVPAPRLARTPRWFALFGVLAGGVLLLAACGGSPSKGVAGLGSATSPSSAAQAPAAGGIRFANCMRSNGVTNFPDPARGGQSQAINRIDPSSPTFLRAYDACRKYAPNGEIGPPTPTAAQLRIALAFAQCMHKHGFPQFPEPLVTAPDPAQADFSLGQGMYFPESPLGGPLNPAEVHSQPFVRAAKTCGVQVATGRP